MVAVVPALPRGAAVELHATAVRDNPAGDRTSCQLTSKVACMSIESHAVVSGDKQNATLSLSVFPTVPGPEAAGPQAAGALLEAVGATLGDALKKMTADGLVALCARLFYTHDHPLANQVAAGLLVKVMYVTNGSEAFKWGGRGSGGRAGCLVTKKLC